MHCGCSIGACPELKCTQAHTRPGAFLRTWILPRAKKVSTGHFFAPVCALVPPFQIPNPMLKIPHTRMGMGNFWQRMRDSNPRERSQSPVCYRYTNPLSAERLYYTQFFQNVKHILDVFSFFAFRMSRFPGIILYKLRNVFQSAIQNGAQLAEGFRFNIFICPKAANCVCANAAFSRSQQVEMPFSFIVIQSLSNTIM